MKPSLTPAQRRVAAKALAEAVSKIGGPKKVGDLVGISGQAVSQWEFCPDAHVLPVADASGVPATRLRPDRYPEGTVLPIPRAAVRVRPVSV